MSLERRSFLKTAAAGAPTLHWMGLAAAAASGGVTAESKFVPIDLSRHFNASSTDFGPHSKARQMGPDADGLVRTLSGARTIRGIPFSLGPGDVRQKSWVAVCTRPVRWAAPKVEIPIGRKAGYLCLAQFCEWDANEGANDDVNLMEQPGQHLADAVLVYEDGSEKIFPVRRRFEVAPTIIFGHQCFNAMQSNSWKPSKLTDPLAQATDWGHAQKRFAADTLGPGELWIWALENPEPDRKVGTLELRAASDVPVMLAGLTLCEGREHPLRRDRAMIYAITLPQATGADVDRWKVEIDLGVVIKTYTLPEFRADTWLGAPGAGLGERIRPADPTNRIYAEVAASRGATLSVTDTRSAAKYQFDLSKLEMGQPLAAIQGSSRIEVLERDKVWLRGQVRDAATGQPTPVRMAFRSKEGRYLPPHGHRTEVQNGWFQDYGSDLKVGASSFAYIDGTFQVELPAGEVFVEISKGFEYQAVRERLAITAGQEELNLKIGRHSNLRSKGWVTADTHVHFLSPSSALLEAQGEGLNLVNLLAAQWGDLYTNVAELSHGPLTSPDNDTIVRLGTENRQHILGHIGLLGGKGAPVYPMSADGPNEAFLGDPLWSTMAEWADACRAAEGVTVGVHFPTPLGEMPADIVLGKIDAVELYPRGENAFRTLGYNEWYRYLNCGYRVSAAGGTDKMNAGTPLGGNRTYAWLGSDEFTFANWAKAVRRGRTFATSGPLLMFEADGHIPGDDVVMSAAGGSVEVKVAATSSLPLHRVEVVFNGRVVAAREQKSGARKITLTEKVAVSGPGWLAARCSTNMDPAIAWPFGNAAHTSPVYLKTPGQDLFSGPAASYMLTLIEGAETYVNTLATRPNEQRMARILKVLREARAHLHQRMHDHGIAYKA